VRPSLVLRRAADYLERHDVDSPSPTAEQLMLGVLGIDRAALYRRDEPLGDDEARAFGRALCRRCAGVPTQHLTGEAGFRRLTLAVRPGVFIPRPETEIVVDAALEVIGTLRAPVVVDVGTGTGAIALAVKQERRDATVWAVDRSPEAVELAGVNAARNGLDVHVRRGDLLSDLEADLVGSVDLVVSNPPYIEPREYASLPREPRADPIEALVGGVAVHEALFAQAATWLRPGGTAVVEIGERQAAKVARAAVKAGSGPPTVRMDLAGRDRVVVATWP
jgi:release factor glutamine methyltransferase